MLAGCWRPSTCRLLKHVCRRRRRRRAAAVRALPGHLELRSISALALHSSSWGCPEILHVASPARQPLRMPAAASSLRDALWGTKSHTEVREDASMPSRASQPAGSRQWTGRRRRRRCRLQLGRPPLAPCPRRLQGAQYQKPRKIPLRIEPKTYFANERTFLAWLGMATTLGTISTAIAGFAGAAWLVCCLLSTALRLACVSQQAARRSRCSRQLARRMQPSAGRRGSAAWGAPPTRQHRPCTRSGGRGGQAPRRHQPGHRGAHHAHAAARVGAHDCVRALHLLLALRVHPPQAGRLLR